MWHACFQIQGDEHGLRAINFAQDQRNFPAERRSWTVEPSDCPGVQDFQQRVWQISASRPIHRAALPARERIPRDKGNFENGVQNVELWVLAPLRHQIFICEAEANRAIRPRFESLPKFQPNPGRCHPGSPGAQRLPPSTTRRVTEKVTRNSVDAERLMYNYLIGDFSELRMPSPP